MRHAAAVAVVALAAVFATAARADGPPPPKPKNALCPVQPDRKALARFAVTYKGRTVNLCCEDCIDVFNGDPEAFLARLPASDATPAAADKAPSTPAARSSAPAAAPSSGLATWAPHAYAGLLALVALGLVTYPLRRRRDRVAEAARPAWRTLLAVGPGTAAAFVLVGVGAQLAIDRHALHEQVGAYEALLAAERERTSQPAVPPRPTVAPRLAATYYRGNDERDAQLENGGYYRTATVSAELLGADRRPLKVGAPVGAGPLWLRVRIERSPHTVNLYHAAIMDSVYLTRDWASVVARGVAGADRVRLTTLTPEQRWEALVPVPLDRLRAVVYVCRAKQVHYAIEHALVTRSGRVAASSDVWIAAVYRPAGLSVPLSEWFDHRPIPELTRPHRTVDPDLTGEYEHGKAPPK